MSGMIKAKKYDWKDSNMALFGSDIEKNIKKASAETEEAWVGSGIEVGVQIWRIESFKVKRWPLEDYGKFFSGDSYIILKTYKVEEELKYDVHFWIGKHSTQDEYGTAAYKTVELDTFHDDKPVQHREVQGHESSLFKSYFDSMTYLKGGCASGFHHVEPTKYKPRLFRVSKEGRRTRVTQIPIRKESVNSGDVFILDNGLSIFQYNGANCSKDEKYEAAVHCQKLESERPRAKTSVIDEGESGERQFLELMEIHQEEEEEGGDGESFEAADKEAELHRLTDCSGEMKMGLEHKGTITRSHLDSNDVFILDNKYSLFVWVGGNTSPDEKKKAMSYAHNYLINTDHPLISITCLKEGAESDDFINSIAA